MYRASQTLEKHKFQSGYSVFKNMPEKVALVARFKHMIYKYTVYKRNDIDKARLTGILQYIQSGKSNLYNKLEFLLL